MDRTDRDFLDALAVAMLLGVGFVVILELLAAKAKRITTSVNGEESEMDFLERIRQEINRKVKRVR